MRIIDVTNEKKNHVNILKFRFQEINQLFDESDTKPLPNREITERAEETIFGYVDEFRITKKVELIVELPDKEVELESESQVVEAIHNHFRAMLPEIKHEMILIKREGFYSCLITLVNLILGLLYIAFVNSGIISMEKLPGIFIGFILIIANWAAMWNTYEFFFYELRNMNRKKMVYKKISTIDITIHSFQK